MMRRGLMAALVAVLLAAGGRLDAAGLFGTFNLRTSLFRKLHRALGAEPLRTQHPVVLAHGICGFDRVKWGPIEIRYFHDLEAHLREIGVDVLTTDVPATGSIEARAQALAAQIDAWRPGQKVNIIAHSMGGLDSRYMISRLRRGDRVASLTMIATPNHGTLLCDWAVYYFSRQYPAVEKFLRTIGLDTTGFHDLSVAHMMKVFNPATPDDPRVRYRSFAGSQKFRNYFAPLMISHAVLRGLEKTLMQMPLAGDEAKALEQLQRAHGLGYTLTRAGFREALQGLPHDWIKPELAGRSDGLVTMSSVRHGQYLGDLDADHLDQMGWLTTFDAKGFYQAIARNLSDEGY